MAILCTTRNITVNSFEPQSHYVLRYQMMTDDVQLFNWFNVYLKVWEYMKEYCEFAAIFEKKSVHRKFLTYDEHKTFVPEAPASGILTWFYNTVGSSLCLLDIYICNMLTLLMKCSVQI